MSAPSMLTANPVVVRAEGLDFRDRHTLRIVEVNVPLLDPILPGRRKEMFAADNQGRHGVRVCLNGLPAPERSVPNLDRMVP